MIQLLNGTNGDVTSYFTCYRAKVKEYRFPWACHEGKGGSISIAPSSTHHYPRYWVQVSCQLHDTAALLPSNKPVSVIRVMKTNLEHYLSSVYFINQPLHVSGIFIAHHQEVYCTYSTGTCCVFSTHSTGVWVSPEPVCTFLRKEKSLASGGIRTSYRLRYPDSQCVTGCTTHPQVSLLPF